LPMARGHDLVRMDKANGYLYMPPKGVCRSGETVEIELRYPYKNI
jgi:hypothetical protein